MVGICAGSEDYPGAAILCTTAAVNATPAMVRYAGRRRLRWCGRFRRASSSKSPRMPGACKRGCSGPARARMRLRRRTCGGCWGRRCPCLSTPTG
nr:NAD(P)H-hydrate dehydratase [Corynebacterium aquatimens]